MLTSFLRSEVTRHSSHSCSTLYHPGILQCKKARRLFYFEPNIQKKKFLKFYIRLNEHCLNLDVFIYRVIKQKMKQGYLGTEYI